MFVVGGFGDLVVVVWIGVGVVFMFVLIWWVLVVVVLCFIC